MAFINTHCASCHNLNGGVQVSFLDYGDVVANKSLIKFNITNNIMPPWAADNIYRKMVHNRIVSPIEETFED